MKRIVAGLLWSLVVMWVGSYVALFMGLTAAVTIPFGLVAAAYVIVDPAEALWGRRLTITPVQHLDKVAASPVQEFAHRT